MTWWELTLAVSVALAVAIILLPVGWHLAKAIEEEWATMLQDMRARFWRDP